MTNEELALRIKGGENQLMDALWAQVAKFVRVRAIGYFLNHQDQCDRLGLTSEDLYQEGYFAIVRAVQGFDPTKQTAFLTYAGWKLKARFCYVLKNNTTHWERDQTYYASSLNAPTSEESKTLADVIADPLGETVLESVIDHGFSYRFGKDLGDALSHFPPRYAHIIHERYWNNVRHTNIAKGLGVNKAVLTRQYRCAFETLRKSEAMRQYHYDLIGY